MILTLTINPSIDRNVLVDRLVFEDRAYILSRSDSAGGRGINASRVLHSFGAKTLAIATSGGANGERFEKLLAKSSFPVKLVRIAHDIRVNFTIIDRHGLAVKLNEQGPPITPEELARVEKTVAQRLESATWLMLCGSIPPDVSSDLYTKLIRLAREKNVKTLLDTDGAALLHGVETGPTVVTPNQQEAERLLNRALITRAHFIEAATRIKSMGPESVLLSLGSRGVVAVNDHQLLEAIPPRIDAISPLGSGDALAAAFVWAATKKKDFSDCVRWGVAAGTASARLAGVEFASLEETKEIYKSVEVRAVK
ncbi:MAG TPA: 1-phosphofructokinase family hexose kinase [Bryobacteraceae bacterium]|nr:1-phosphofructokinase family hexose kinase [Bryobacteraceae bacterium]